MLPWTNGDKKRGRLKSAISVAMIAGLLLLAQAACAEKAQHLSNSAHESSFSLSLAAPVGTTAKTIIEFSDIYRAPETYNASIVVLEILRGERSMDLLRRASGFNKPAKGGFEYVLARIRFEYSARGAPGDKAWKLSDDQFNGFSSDGILYETVSIPPPTPTLNGNLKPGDSREGFVMFSVAKDDKKPLLAFIPGDLWFRLY